MKANCWLEAKYKRNNNGNYIVSACSVPGMLPHALCMLTNLTPNNPMMYFKGEKLSTEVDQLNQGLRINA